MLHFHLRLGLPGSIYYIQFLPEPRMHFSPIHVTYPAHLILDLITQIMWWEVRIVVFITQFSFSLMLIFPSLAQISSSSPQYRAQSAYFLPLTL
jgi:hypothetical protein